MHHPRRLPWSEAFHNKGRLLPRPCFARNRQVAHASEASVTLRNDRCLRPPREIRRARPAYGTVRRASARFPVTVKMDPKIAAAIAAIG